MFSSQFICATERVCDYDSHVPAPLFRKVFTVHKMPHAASLTLCGLGLYELFVNGKRITKGALAPYINNPDDILYYDAYDLLPYLREGENVFGVMLGNGFFNPFGGAHWGFDKAPWRGPLRLAFSLEIEDEDGRTVQEADGSVRVSDSAVLLDDLRIGAFYDAAREQAGWCDVGFDDSGWGHAKPIASPKGEARLCEAEPVRVYRELRPISVTHVDELCYVCEASASYDRPIACTRVKNAYVYDFGENNAGVRRLPARHARLVKRRMADDRRRTSDPEINSVPKTIPACAPTAVGALFSKNFLLPMQKNLAKALFLCYTFLSYIILTKNKGARIWIAIKDPNLWPASQPPRWPPPSLTSR